MVHDVEQRIARYTPSAGLAADLSVEGLAIVRSAVSAAEPVDVAEAGRMLTHAAHHVARALRRGEPPTITSVFGPASVAASIEEAAKDSASSVSPFAANIRRIAQRAAPRSGHVPAFTISQPPLKAGYDSDEIGRLRAAAVGMAPSERSSFLGALALGLGAGLIGPSASNVLAEDLVVDGECVWVPAPWMLAGWLPVTGDWVDVLRRLADSGRPGPVTEAYTTAGAQRLGRCLSHAVGTPRFDADRLRAAWVARLLRGGVPIDITAAAANIRPWSLLKHTTAIPTPTPTEVIAWLSSSGVARPPVPLAAPAPSRSGIAQPGPSHPSVDEALASFVPIDDRVAAMWTDSLGDELRSLIRATADTGGRAHNLAVAASALLTWSVQQPGVPLRLDALLKVSTVRRFVAVTKQTNAASAASYGSLLRALGTAADTMSAKATQAPREAAVPLTDAEIGRMEEVRSGLRPADQRVLDTYRVLGLGAGLRQEIPAVDGVGVIVAGDTRLLRLADRTVAVCPEWRDLLDELVSSAPAGTPLTGVRSGRTAPHRQRVSAELGFDLQPSRLRATWLLRHLNRGVPYQVLAAAAGTKISELNSLVDQVAERAVDDVNGWIAAASTKGPN